MQSSIASNNGTFQLQIKFVIKKDCAILKSLLKCCSVWVILKRPSAAYGISLANKQQDCSWPTRMISKQRRSEPRYPHVSYKLLHTHKHMMSHTPPTHTHTRIHTIIWHIPLQNIDSNANKERGREKESVSWPRTAEKGKLLAERTSCFKSQGTYLPPPSHIRGNYLTLSVHLHIHRSLQAFNISVLSARAV